MAYLWWLDEVANPRRLPIRSLTLSYVEGAVNVELPESWGFVAG